MKKRIQIKEALFRTWITVFYGEPPPMFWEIPKTLRGRSLTDMVEYNPCIWLRNKDLSTLVHELVHCVADIHRRKWIVQSSDSEEVFAYMMDYFFTKIYLKLDKIPNEEFNY